MKKSILFFTAILFAFAFTEPNFKKEQLKNSRVRTAYADKWGLVKGKLQKAGIDTSHFEIFIRVFKQDAELEVWAKSKKVPQFKLVEKYAVCSSSGTLGPKRRQGDGQVPEGFYKVEVFNPNSNYYLSLGINYPNKSDKIISAGVNAGGDIMIHGNCVTIGCMPLTDDKIKEVYIMAVEARNGGQAAIPVHIFPTRMNDKGMELLRGMVKDDKERLQFWNNLKEGYVFFEEKKTEPLISVDEKGRYILRN